MARNSEKALLMMNRWQSMRRIMTLKQLEEVPKNAKTVTTLIDAENWRQNIEQDLVNKLVEIQNSGLTESNLITLNSSINKLIKAKNSICKRIVELGGIYYRPKCKLEDEYVTTKDGKRYFGAARALPNVKKITIVSSEEFNYESKKNLFAKIDTSYYGIGDQEIFFS